MEPLSHHDESAHFGEAQLSIACLLVEPCVHSSCAAGGLGPESFEDSAHIEEARWFRYRSKSYLGQPLDHILGEDATYENQVVLSSALAVLLVPHLAEFPSLVREGQRR